MKSPFPRWIPLLFVLLLLAPQARADTPIIEFSGLFGIAVERTDTLSEAWVLAPNSTDPEAEWIPPIARFGTVHEPQLLVIHGLITSTDATVRTDLKVCSPDGKPSSASGFDLTGYEVEVNGFQESLTANRNPKGDPSNASTDRGSLHFLADMDVLAMKAVASSPLGGLSSKLIAPDCESECYRLSTRVHFTRGYLQTSKLWTKNNYSYYPGTDFVFSLGKVVEDLKSQFLSERVALTGTADSVLIELRPLGMPGAEPKRIAIAPDSNGLLLRFRHSPLDCDDSHSNHFKAHYLLRDNWQYLTDPVSPQPVGTYDSNDNPQCSPVEETP